MGCSAGECQPISRVDGPVFFVQPSFPDKRLSMSCVVCVFGGCQTRCCFHADNFTSLFAAVQFSEELSRREREEAAYVFFIDFLEECEGDLMHVHKNVGFGRQL